MKRHPTSPAPGIRRHGAGWQTAIKVSGERDFAQWPLDTPLKEMQAWQKDTRARLQLLTTQRPPAGTFAADVEKYLKLSDVQKMATYSERVQHLREWKAVFGDRRRRKITPADIEAQRDAWLESRGERDGKALPGYSASAVNHRLRALANLWRRLDGRHVPNPVHEVAECEEPDAEARGLPYEVIESILAAIPDTWIGKKADNTFTVGKPRPSQTKARLRVIAYTGLSHTQLMRLTPADVDLENATLRLIARKKGRKIRRAHDKPRPVLLPLIPPAVDAFKEFDRLKCWGTFSRSAMRKAFVRACQKLELTGLRPYDFRHSYLSAVYGETRDLRVTGAFGGHRSERTTLRYAIAAVNAHVAAAAAKVRAKLASDLASSGTEQSGKSRNNADATPDATVTIHSEPPHGSGRIH